MKNLRQIKKIIGLYRQNLKRQYGIEQIGVFGSYVRQEANKNSDVDVLVEFNRKLDLLKFIHLENYLSDILGVKVDLVMKDALKPRIGKHILKEVVYL